MALLAAGTAGWWWSTLPRTPEELYRARCGACHALPDLSKWQAADMAQIVRTMRRLNGAAAVISADEARLITQYLEQQRTP